MELGPIWRALMRNKTSYVLIALQIAVTMAIMVNAINIIQERSTQMARPSGVDEANIFYLSSFVFDPDADREAIITQDLNAIRSFPGVQNAILSNTVPLSGGGWSDGITLEADPDMDSTGVAIYFTDEHGIDTFDVNLIAGRNFSANEVNWHDFESDAWPPLAIMTQAMVEELFPESPYEEALGKTVYIHDTKPVTIIGIVERMQAAWNSWSGVERSMLVPVKRGTSAVRYVIRAEDGYRDEIMPQIEEMLTSGRTDRIISNMRTMEETRQRSYLRRRINGENAAVRRDRINRYHRARHRRTCKLQRCTTYEADRHAPRTWRNAACDPALLHAGELPDQYRRGCRRCGHRDRHQHVDGRRIWIATHRLVPDSRRYGCIVACRADRGIRTCPTRNNGAAGVGDTIDLARLYSAGLFLDDDGHRVSPGDDNQVTDFRTLQVLRVAGCVLIDRAVRALSA